MNKKANTVAFGLLPVFALAACLAVIITFFQYDSSMSGSINDVSSTIRNADFNYYNILSIAQTAMVSASVNGISKESFSKAANGLNSHIEGQGNFFLLIQKGDFSIYMDGNRYVLDMPGLYTGYSSNNLKIIRPVGAMEFDAKGQFIRFINK